MRFLISLIILLYILPLQGQFHEDVLAGMEGSELLNALQDNYTPVFILTYSQARDKMYREIDNVNDTVTCVYSGHKKYLRPNTTNAIGDLLEGGANGINCEHTYPQSLGAGDGNARTNMHHLYPARDAVNSARSNYPFKEIDDNQTDDWYFEDSKQTSIPTSNIDAYSERDGNRFEPRESHKGDVARSVFYFYTIYRSQAIAADPNFFNLMDDDLCDWHLLDPVDQKEWDRTYDIAVYQENLVNPFVLDCTLAERLYCDGQAACMTTSTENQYLNYFEFSPVYPNPSNGNISIPFEIKDKGNLKIELINLYGQNLQTLLNQSHQAGQYELNVNLSEQGQAFNLLKFEFNNGKEVFIQYQKLMLKK